MPSSEINRTYQTILIRWTYEKGQEKKQIIEDLSNKQLTDIIEEMDPDDKADIIAELATTRPRPSWTPLSRKKSREVEELLKYAEDTAGGIMHSLFCPA